MKHRSSLDGLVARTAPAVVSLGFLLALGVASCASDDFVDKAGTKDGGADGQNPASGSCKEGTQQCYARLNQKCVGGVWETVERCTDVCSSQLKRCAACIPGRGQCKDGAVYACKDDGTLGGLDRKCPTGECAGGICNDPCSRAAANRSYLGCEYWPTVTMNAGLVKDFDFAVVVANPQSEAVNIVVGTAENAELISETIAPDTIKVITLPWVDALKQKRTSGGLLPMPVKVSSTLARRSAYRLTSSLPVTVYQFNPLNYVKEGDCTKGTDVQPDDKKCHSYSNDASLLLPDGVLTKDYMVIARQSTGVKRGGLGGIFGGGKASTSPGFFSVVATKPGETKLTIKFAGDTTAGANGSLAAYQLGQTAEFTLQQWDVLQMASAQPEDCKVVKKDDAAQYCDLSKFADLTGTEIKSTKNIAVFGGHDCTFVPFDKWACDHLEEQMFPLDTWGREYVGVHTLSSGDDPSIYRVVSADDNNKITFSGGVREPVTLNRGQHIEFQTTKPFFAKGVGRFALVQYMVGQGSNAKEKPGDPAMALAVPTEQFRKSYQFLAPKSFQQNYVNITTRKEAEVSLDGKRVENFVAIPDSDFQAAQIKIEGGAHKIESNIKVGISVYGVGDFTSYMYPGGLDLRILE